MADELQRTPEQSFGLRIQQTASRQLTVTLGSEGGKKAAQSVVMAFLSAMRSARDPSAYLACTEASVAEAVGTTIDTQLYPGGPNPSVYLVPQATRRGEAPSLQWRITHRGLCILASRAGYAVSTAPVSVTDHVRISMGEVIEHEADPAAWPERLDQLLGVIVIVRRLDDGVVICRAWLPRQAIEQRRLKARDQSVWSAWPIEMGQKTAIKWAAARGLIPMDSPELRAALEADARGDIIDVTATSSTTQPRGRAALGLGEPRQIAEDTHHEEGAGVVTAEHVGDAPL